MFDVDPGLYNYWVVIVLMMAGLYVVMAKPNMIKKLTAHGHDIPPVELADELGDVLWYLAEAASACGLTLDEIARQNVDKLRARYPEGFSQERSRNRKV